jgi:hypothetical protein
VALLFLLQGLDQQDDGSHAWSVKRQLIATIAQRVLGVSRAVLSERSTIVGVVSRAKRTGNAACCVRSVHDVTREKRWSCTRLLEKFISSANE